MSVGLYCKFSGGVVVVSDGFEYNPKTWEKRTDSTKFFIFKKPFGQGVLICTGNPELSKRALAEADSVEEMTLLDFAKGCADFLRKEADRVTSHPRETEKMLEQTPMLIAGYDRTTESFPSHQISRGYHTELKGADFFSIGIGANYAFSGKLKKQPESLEEAIQSALLAYANSLKIRGVEGYPRMQIVGTDEVTTLDAPTCTFLGNLAVLDLLTGSNFLKTEVEIMPASEKQVSPAVVEKLKEIGMSPSILFKTQMTVSTWQEILGPKA
ncbi:MAG: hypothetical protein V1820_04785 [archaeon]